MDNPNGYYGTNLETDIMYIKGVGPARGKILNKHGINIVSDLIYHLPRRYLDRTNIKTIRNLRIGDEAVILGRIDSFGVKPTNPSTEYGYISVDTSNNELKDVKSFIEKPGLEKAKLLIKQPDTLWNAGMFFFDGKWLGESIKIKNPEMYSIMQDLLPTSELDQTYFYFDKMKFAKLTDISFDKAFVESNEKNLVATLEAGWTDLGSWHALTNLQKKPEHGLTLYPEGDYSRTEKPWGYFEVLFETEFSKVKILSVDLGQMLSMQMHKYRAETWYVTQGVATVTKGDTTFDVYPGESVVIDKKEKHRVRNSGDEVLEIIEIQRTCTCVFKSDIDILTYVCRKVIRVFIPILGGTNLSSDDVCKIFFCLSSSGNYNIEGLCICRI